MVEIIELSKDFLNNILIASLTYTGLIALLISKKDWKKIIKVFMIISFSLAIISSILSITEYQKLFVNNQYRPMMASGFLILSMITFAVGIFVSFILSIIKKETIFKSP